MQSSGGFEKTDARSKSTENLKTTENPRVEGEQVTREIRSRSTSSVRFRSHLEGTIDDLRENLEKLAKENDQLKKRVKELGM